MTESYSPPLSLLYFALLASACTGIGLGLLRPVRFSGVFERIVFSIPLGIGVVGLLVLAAGLLGFLNAPLLLTTIVVLGGIGLWTARGSLAPARSFARTKPTVLVVLLLSVLGILGICTLIAALAPPAGNEWDALAYHLAVPRTYLREGRIFYIPYTSHANFPFVLQMHYVLMLGLGSVGGAKLMHALCGWLLVGSVYTFARPRYGQKTATVAALILATTPIVLWEASVAYVDLASALFTWLSLIALIRAAERKEQNSTGFLLLSAVMMGLALGTKYTVLGFWGMLLAGVLIGGSRIAATFTERTRRALLWAGVSLLIAAPWYVKTWLYTGNPVYPFYYGIFGGRYWSAENAALYAADQARFGVGKTVLDLLLAPWRVTMETALVTAQRPYIFTEYVLFGLSPLYLALLLAWPFVPVSPRRVSGRNLVLLLFGGGVFVLWFFLMQQTRYLIPALPALAVLAAHVAVTLWRRTRIARWGLALLGTASVLWAIYLAAAQLALPALPVVTGRQSVDKYLLRRLGPVWSAQKFINQNTPPTAKIALFDEPRAFYLNREYAWAQPNHALLFPWTNYANANDWLADFQRRGYTFLLVNTNNTGELSRSQRWWTLLGEAAQAGKLRLVFEDRGVVVLEIASSEAGVR